jgi:DNA/RNA-binding domain of Phe-tRNA-synthetase-like protein
MQFVISKALEDRALPPHLRISSLVVQASRVMMQGINFKLFRAGTEEQLRRTSFGQSMRHPDELHAWENAYNDWGIYSADLAQEALYELRRLRRDQNAPSTDAGAPRSGGHTEEEVDG